MIAQARLTEDIKAAGLDWITGGAGEYPSFCV
jgi:hypothetical protein